MILVKGFPLGLKGLEYRVSRSQGLCLQELRESTLPEGVDGDKGAYSSNEATS